MIKWDKPFAKSPPLERVGVAVFCNCVVTLLPFFIIFILLSLDYLLFFIEKEKINKNVLLADEKILFTRQK